MAQSRTRYDVQGWGADLDPSLRPAVPKEKPSSVLTVRGVLPSRQFTGVKIHRSIEHPDLTPVFGTTCPPRWLSGKLRDIAYTLSEDRLSRWMTLLAADRVDVVENIFVDLFHGRIPNIFKERGWKSELTHADTQRKIRNVAVIGVGVGAALGAFWLAKRQWALGSRDRRSRV